MLTAAAGAALAMLVQAPAYADVIKGGPNGNTLGGTAGADTIYGYGGNDVLYGHDGGDTLYGNEDNDKLYGGTGQDTLYGGPGTDYLFGGEGSAADKLFGGGGNDTLNGGYGPDVLYGKTGNDVLRGGKGSAGDKLYGGVGADTLYGGAGPDVLRGDKGHDVLRGGDGNDVIRARDGMRDRVHCGRGSDKAILDWRDVLIKDNGCEKVDRPAITYADLKAMYGTKLGAESVVRKGLDSLNRQMNVGKISRTPRRTAAFLATLVNESAMRYDALQPGTSKYRGRGFIQLTGDFNYRAAGNYFDINLIKYPGKANNLAWSAKIARWYWTVARPDTNKWADRLNMHEVNKNIGFAWTRAEATERCDDFKDALRRLTGGVPSGIKCYP